MITNYLGPDRFKRENEDELKTLFGYSDGQMKDKYLVIVYVAGENILLPEDITRIILRPGVTTTVAKHKGYDASMAEEVVRQLEARSRARFEKDIIIMGPESAVVLNVDKAGRLEYRGEITMDMGNSYTSVNIKIDQALSKQTDLGLQK